MDYLHNYIHFNLIFTCIFFFLPSELFYVVLIVIVRELLLVPLPARIILNDVFMFLSVHTLLVLFYICTIYTIVAYYYARIDVHIMSSLNTFLSRIMNSFYHIWLIVCLKSFCWLIYQYCHIIRLQGFQWCYCFYM